MTFPWQNTRDSQSKGPDYSAKGDVKSLLQGSKKTHSESHYRPAEDDSKMRCSECEYYVKPGQPRSDCRKVIGVIEAEGTCDLYKARTSEPPVAGGMTITISMGQGS